MKPKWGQRAPEATSKEATEDLEAEETTAPEATSKEATEDTSELVPMRHPNRSVTGINFRPHAKKGQDGLFRIRPKDVAVAEQKLGMKRV